jgi:hypothetical protein
VRSILQGSYLMQDAIFQHESSRLTRDEPAAPWRIAAMKGHAACRLRADISIAPEALMLHSGARLARSPKLDR